MGIIAKNTGSEIKYDPVPQGLHNAICYGIFDIGTHRNKNYDVDQHKIIIVWELPDQRIDIEKDGEKKNLPRAFSNEYTLSLGENSYLRRDLESWRARGFTAQELKGFDIVKLLGVPCQLNIIHKPSKTDPEKIYANLSGVVKAIEGYDNKPENPLIYYSIEEHGKDIPEGIPEWIVNKIKQSKEFQAPDNVTPLDVGLDELGETTEVDPDVPF